MVPSEMQVTKINSELISAILMLAVDTFNI